jgi:hypothetical protein
MKEKQSKCVNIIKWNETNLPEITTTVVTKLQRNRISTEMNKKLRGEQNNYFSFCSIRNKWRPSSLSILTSDLWPSNFMLGNWAMREDCGVGPKQSPHPLPIILALHPEVSFSFSRCPQGTDAAHLSVHSSMLCSQWTPSNPAWHLQV